MNVAVLFEILVMRPHWGGFQNKGTWLA